MNAYSLAIYNRAGDLYEVMRGDAEHLRSQGVDVTTVPGQKAWTCSLRKHGRTVATCRRGVWQEVTL